MTTPLARHVRFDLDDVASFQWNPSVPHFALAANSLSLLMPAVEPYVIRSVGRAGRDLDGSQTQLKIEVDAFCRQEAAHQAQHRELNAAICAQFTSAQPLERRALATYRWVEQHTSDSFGLAFAAGSEAIAYSIARWFSSRADRLMTGADPVVGALFVWHLAEEVEHKSVAIDVYRACGGGRLRYAAATMLSLLMLAVFTWWGTVAMMADDGRLWSVGKWVQLTGWAVSVAFDILPSVAVSVFNGHHPSDLADPSWYAAWLDQIEATDVVAADEWNMEASVPHRIQARPQTALR